MSGDRYTRRDAEKAFERLLGLLGKRPAGSYGDVGGWRLDYAACYGGFVVEEVANEGGGIRQPLGSARCSAREFCDRVRFLADALEVRSEPSPEVRIVSDPAEWQKGLES